MNIPERIKQKREELRETQEQFGKRFGTSAMGVSYWERGMRKPSYAILNFIFDDSPLTNGAHPHIKCACLL
jgi:transcriptional regulator with XRE-family HTH domain